MKPASLIQAGRAKRAVTILFRPDSEIKFYFYDSGQVVKQLSQDSCVEWGDYDAHRRRELMTDLLLEGFQVE